MDQVKGGNQQGAQQDVYRLKLQFIITPFYDSFFDSSIHRLNLSFHFIASVHHFISLLQFIGTIHSSNSSLRFIASNNCSNSLLRFIYYSLIRFIAPIHRLDSSLQFIAPTFASIHCFDSSLPILRPDSSLQFMTVPVYWLSLTFIRHRSSSCPIYQGSVPNIKSPISNTAPRSTLLIYQ